MQTNRIALILMLSAAPLSQASAQAVAGFSFFVKNTTTDTLSCRMREGAAPWSEPETIAPGGQFTALSDRVSMLLLSCAAPVASKTYRIHKESGMRCSGCRARKRCS